MAAGVAAGVFASFFPLGSHFIIAFVVGLLVGRAVLWASGRYRSTTVAWIAVGGAVWAYVVPGIVISIDSGLGLRAGVQVLGVLIAGFAFTTTDCSLVSLHLPTLSAKWASSLES